MDRLEALRLFIAVADKASFAEAARALQVSPTSASRAVAELEEELGVALLRRSTRSVRLTPEGEAYLERCRQALELIEDADRMARGEDSAPRGLLSITAPVVMARRHVRPAVNRLLAEHPLLAIRLISTDRIVRIAEEGVDVAVRIGPLADSALHAIKLGETRRVLLASPEYLARRGSPASPGGLSAHDLIAFDNFTHNSEWRFAGGETVRVEPRLLTSDVEVAVDAAVSGLGVTQLLSYQVADLLADGRLQALLSGFEPQPVPISAVFQSSRQRAPNVRAFLAAIRARLAEAPL